ncbi:MAG: bifunctional transcriptional activator/DNA repair protein Ada [Ignavibacteriae bacterium]|nr:bifunctional transcriptional activator/DNA repair protein Ada [Ignavibacteriota bacterium]
MELTHKVMYNAAVKKDVSFEGIFFTAVKTTGIFCRPTCTARKPKIENVEFYKTSKEAILKGYRPCKVCNPLEKLNATPIEIKNILNELNENPSQKIKDFDLVKKGIEPNKVRRWFLKNHGITFHAYQRMLRINNAFKKIQNGKSITETAFDSGYNSLSGFNDSFKSVFETSPSNSKTKNIIELKRIETKLGTMIACSTKDGICLLEFSDRKMLETELKQISKYFDAKILQGDSNHLTNLEKQLHEYFDGNRKEFTIPIATSGTVFQNIVWEKLLQIPFGKTKSYKDIAEQIDKPTAVRAVANANGMNKIAILIPCHRVIGSDGKLTGYGGGLWRKKELLDLEIINKGSNK